MKKCPYCGNQIEDDNLFCTECGKPVPHARYPSRDGWYEVMIRDS